MGAKQKKNENPHNRSGCKIQIGTDSCTLQNQITIFIYTKLYLYNSQGLNNHSLNDHILHALHKNCMVNIVDGQN